MAFDETNVKLISVLQRLMGAYRASVTCNQFLKVLLARAIHAITGYELVVPEASTMPAAESLASGAAMTPDAMELTATPPTFPLKRFGGEIVIDALIADKYSNINEIREIQIAFQSAAIRDEIGKTNIVGDEWTTSSQYDGVKLLNSNLIGANNDAANGGTVLYSDLTRLKHKVTVDDQGPHYFVGNDQAIEKYEQSCLTLGFPPMVVEVAGFDRPLIAHQGIPILRDDNIPNDETRGSGSNLTSIYAVQLGWERGLSLIFPEHQGGMNPVVQRIGKEASDKEILRVTLTCGLALFSKNALARLEGIA